ncbi:MAG: uracil-DNA glycosylase [Sedimentisphaerales bacterium]|nr:uracil-DNA glycosylase [Sedimentisphaerales bacterium]
METPSKFKHLARTLITQMETDLFLGGAWLPMEPVDKTPSPRTALTKKTSSIKDMSNDKTDIVHEKRRRLAELAQTVSQCKKCDLQASRINCVPGEGNPDARIVFVGEAPGESEDQQGRPFVGRAGQLLTNMIKAMGLKRDEVFICNILKCRPPKNRDPQGHEIAACIDYLSQQLDIIEPEMIVALGAHAARTLLNTNSSIGQLRGRVHEYLPHPLAQPVKLVATYHPAYVLRYYTKENRMCVWQDMQKVLQALGLPIPSPNK